MTTTNLFALRLCPSDIWKKGVLYDNNSDYTESSIERLNKGWNKDYQHFYHFEKL